MIVSVAIDIPAFQLFDYIAPSGESLLGRRVRVNFKGKEVIGLVMEEGEESRAPSSKLKKVEEVLADLQPLPPAFLALAVFCSQYYMMPPGEVVAAMLPKVFRTVGSVRVPAGYQLVNTDMAHHRHRSTVPKRVCEFLRDGECKTAKDIKAATGAGIAVLRRMLEDGVLERDYYWQPEKTDDEEPEQPLHLTKAQQQAIAEIELNADYKPYLLFGDTGAGKTEVYLQLVEKTLAAGGQALVLTPEIHLTPQLEKSFVRRFSGRRICVLHSGLGDNERARNWMMALEGVADVVLGTRLAVFAPMPKLKLIVVDEEHDDSYKQEEGVIFSARDVAVWRAHYENIPLVCGSATPSLESFWNARRNKYTMIRMNARPRTGRVDVSLVAEEGALFHGMTQRFVSELAGTLAYNRQALVFINRRGYAPVYKCTKCEWLEKCRACESFMTYHKQQDKLMCHRCGSARPARPRCSVCEGKMAPLGFGTQRVEEALKERFAPIVPLRLDSDAMAGRDKFQEARQRIVSGEAKLLIGTQIVAKGHNFPHLSFIGVLNADAGLWSADFRAEERLRMLLSQVIGRGTRNQNGCKVLIQTSNPMHPFYRELMSDDLESCWQRLSKERRRAKLPPFAFCALLRASSPVDAKLRGFFSKAHAAAERCKNIDVQMYDAVPSPMPKLANRWRWQMLAQSENRASLHKFLVEWREKIPPSGGDVRWHIDVDPVVI